uniref:CSON002885 protein n=1 Tax=Culicoides sonorensis TaxID=179676 RepID=A0A336L4F7_CULSO
MDESSEQSIIGARASVMVYDDNQKKWIPSGTSSGLSKVQIYHHQQNNTFRVVGRKLQDHEVVINCSILKGLKYNQATATFHQWRDSKFVYGLNFSSQQDAEAFARAMMHALEILSGRIPAPLGPGLGYDEDMGYRTMTREDAAIMQQNNNSLPNNVISPQTPTSIPQSPPQQGHHRTNSAPPVPPPAQQVQPKPNYQQQQSQQGQIYVPSQQYNQQLQLYQGQGQNQVNMIPPQQQIPNSQSQPNARNGPIYVPSNVSKVNQQQQVQQQQQQIPNPPNMFAPPNPPPMQQQQQQQNQQQVPQAPPQPMMNNYGHQANGGYGNQGQYGSQAPQVPQVNSPPQAVPPPPDFGNNGMSIPAPPQPPAAPMPMLGGGGPPPPPPPMPNLAGSKSNGMDMSSLAAQLQAAKLKKSQTLPKAAPTPAENSGSSTSSAGSGNYGTIGRTTGGMASMMDEMAKTLARRRAQVDKKEPDSNNDDAGSRQRPWEKSNTLPHKLGNNSNSNNGNSNSNNSGNGSGSPTPLRKRFGSASEETILKQVNGDGFSIPSAIDLENFKADILQEVKLEIAKAKQEIIEGN